MTQTGRSRLEQYYDRLTKGAYFPVYHGTQDASGTPDAGQSKLVKVGKERFRLLIPATNTEINLCKTLMTAHALGYPMPTLIGYNETYDHSGKLVLLENAVWHTEQAVGMMAGGSHIMKIVGVLEYLDGLDSSADDDLVMSMDAYGGSWYEWTNRVTQDTHREADIWFQLRVETLIERYYAINAAENERIRQRLGRAADIEGIEQTIVFGSGKRCAPNQVHTVACYPVPDSPLPMDTYGANTDTIMGRNRYTSLRQKWLNSGFIMGPVKDLRPMFRRALEKVEALQDYPEWDNGSGGSNFMYVSTVSCGSSQGRRTLASFSAASKCCSYVFYSRQR